MTIPLAHPATIGHALGMTYVIETRTSEMDSDDEYHPAGPWHRDGLSSRPDEIDGIKCASLEEGAEIIKNLRGVGPDWNADYRCVIA